MQPFELIPSNIGQSKGFGNAGEDVVLKSKADLIYFIDEDTLSMFLYDLKENK